VTEKGQRSSQGICIGTKEEEHPLGGVTSSLNRVNGGGKKTKPSGVAEKKGKTLEKRWRGAGREGNATSTRGKKKGKKLLGGGGEKSQCGVRTSCSNIEN